MALPLSTVASDAFQGQSVEQFRIPEIVEKEVGAFEKFCKTQTVDEEDADKEELTCMEGFRYRVDESPFPVYRGGKKCEEFPMIPIGMLDVWRQQNNDDEF